MADSSPTVSVLMLAYNNDRYVGQAIESVLAQQTPFPFELVIGEDCSKDRTLTICRSYAREATDRIRLLAGDFNRGIAGNAKRCLSTCHGKYIAICDADDLWVDPHKLAKQVAFLEEHPDYGLVHTAFQGISADGSPVDVHHILGLPEKPPAGRVFFPLLRQNFIINSTTLFRRDTVLDHDIDDDPSYYVHDYFMWLHIAIKHKIHFLDELTTQYRWHPSSITKDQARKRRNRQKARAYWYRLFPKFHQDYAWPLSEHEKARLFSRLIFLSLYRGGRFRERRRMAALAARYLPGPKSGMEHLTYLLRKWVAQFTQGKGKPYGS